MKNSWWYRWSALFVVMAMVVAACGDDDDGVSAPEDPGESTAGTAAPASDDEPVAGGDITFFISSEYATLGPSSIRAVGGPAAGVTSLAIFDTLIDVDYKTGEVTPRIAESLEPNDDLSEWTMTIRDGVTFTDGTPYDAEAVKFNWDMMADPAVASPCISTITSFESYTVTDPSTLVIALPEPRAAFPNQLSQCASAISSPTALQEHGDQYGTSPETTAAAGPFMLAEWVPGDHMTVVRNPDFWDSPRPYLDSITFQPVPDNGAAADGLLTGAADIITLSSITADYARLRDAGMELFSQQQEGGLGVLFNTTRAPLDDVRVREALVAAYEPTDINEKVSAGEATMADTYFTEESAYYDPDIAQEDSDLARAQSLIDEYVAENGGPVQISALAASVFADLFTTLQQQWSRLENVEVALEPVTGTVAGERIGTYDYMISPGVVTANTSESFIDLFLSDQRGPTALGWSDPQVDAAIEESRGESDDEARRELFSEITQQAMNENHWFMLLWRLITPQALNPEEIKGVEQHDPSTIGVAGLWLAEG